MKVLLAVIVMSCIVLSPVFAQQEKELTGKVDSINPIDPERGDFDGGLILRDDSGKVTSFDINTSTVISDIIKGKIKSGDIQDGNRVSVSYLESGEKPSAVTITRIPD